jgi:hypothetical protein
MITPRKSMRRYKIALLVALPIASSLAGVAGTAFAQGADADAAKAPSQPSAGVASTPDPSAAVQSRPAGDPAGTEGAAAPTESAGGEPAAEGTDTADAAAEGAGEQPSSREKEPEKEPEQVTGAFGIPLGERFEPCLVAKVLGEEPVTYRTADKTQRKGTRYLVEPKVPNLRFNTYAVDTTADGLIFAVRGDYVPEARESKCDVTKEIAASLEEKYGEPRGRSPYGHWYAFRDMSVKHYRGIRLYANRCRQGIYQIVYGDEGVKGAAPPSAPEPTETSGL